MLNIDTIKTQEKSLLELLYKEVIEEDEYCIEDIVQEIDYVIDIGANIGVFSLHAHDKLKINKGIICLEPQVDNYYYLKKNMTNIKDTSVLLLNEALGDGSYLNVTTAPKNKGMYQCVKTGTGEQVATRSLKNLLEHVGVRKDDKVVLKSDCEGGEVNLMTEEAMIHMDNFIQISLEVHYGDTYFKHCPQKEKYKEWLTLFKKHSVYKEDWASDKNGRVVLRRSSNGN